MGQSRIETLLLEEVLQSGHVEVRRHTVPASLSIDMNFVHDHCQDSYPIRVDLMNIAGPETSPIVNGGASTHNSREVIEAKYLLGCDGAHSWVRSQLGLKLEGTSRDVEWGVLDTLPITDFRESMFLCPSTLEQAS